ncbi:MAG: hypothetical protein FD145_983 [Candidatus Saganbacteria bacterium]|uniref:Gliding motility protein SprA N-terminal domain-containing protein n=1 Tax=Candidatus Saganbacteria bacterium TaxID=2575572 RepID=A0A833L0T7_UNCSA|nr:MAG: hypothetical protein FD145_983 [Candidatus Saganbacteria bacterium]
MKLKPLLFLFILFVFSSVAFSEDYPKIDITGMKKWDFKQAKVAGDYFSGLTQLGGYSPNINGTPWQERLQLKILAQLTEKLKVTYDIEQQPEMPDKYDVKVNYDNKHELAFGDINPTFSGNEFASATKFVNGVMISSKGDGYEFLAVPSSKLKSQVMALTKQKGNNTKGPYSLGHGNIVEGSERIELNGSVLQKGSDYIIDYFEGKINFNRILTTADEFAYNYEYSNIMDIFFPTLSKRDFFGAQGRYTFDPSLFGKKAPIPQQAIETTKEVFPTNIISLETTAKSSLEANASSEAPSLEETMAEESTGKFRLKNVPVQLFSEALTFRGVKLKKNEDYIIKYDDGAITLLLPVLPTAQDPLEVSYSYFETAKEAETISGTDSKGPYALAYGKIIQFSERVLVNSRLIVRDLDYTIDYENGKISFNSVVSKTSAINITYLRIVMELPPAPLADKFKKSMTVGMTYLKESAKKGTSTAVGDKIETKSHQSLIDNNNVIYLSFYPVIPTSEGGLLSVKVGGAELTYGVDYIFPTTEVDSQTGYVKVNPATRLAYINDRTDPTGGYDTGTIKILTSLEATAEVSVLYNFKKPISSRYSGAGNGGRGPYYIQNYRYIIPGTERVEVWDTGSSNIESYVRNSSFEADAGDKGYTISYTKEAPYIIFNKELASSKNFSVYFQYVPPSAPVGGDISQSVTGFDGNIKIGEFLQVEGAYASSSNDRVATTVGTSETQRNFTTPTSKLQKLAFTPVVENSETVRINGKVRNRDTDYFIDYAGGQITFYNLTLAAQDVVSVDYQYQSTSGGVQTDLSNKTDTAYKYSAKSSLGKFLDLSFSRKQIGFNFAPLGGTAIGVGSDYNDYSISLKPQRYDFTVSHSYRDTKNPLSGRTDIFTRSIDRAFSMGVNPFNILKISGDFRNLDTKGDPVTVGGAKSSDSVQNSYSVSVVPATIKRGIASFNILGDVRRSESKDNLTLTSSFNDSIHYGGNLSFGEKIKFHADAQHSNAKGLAATNGQENPTSYSDVQDISYDLNLDLTFWKLQKWTAYGKVINHEAKTTLPTPESFVQTRNTSIHTDLTPFSILSLSYDKNRQETPSVTVAGRNPASESTALNVRLTPFSAISSSWGYNEDYSILETGRESKGRSNTASLDWAMISFSKVKLNSRYNLYSRNSNAPSGTLEVSTDTRTLSQDYKFVVDPFPFISLSPGFTQEEYYNLVSTTSEALTTSNQTFRIHVDYNPIKNVKVAFDNTNKITSKTTSDQKIEISLPKTNLSMATTLTMFSWGDIIHNYDQEENRGEVIAGGTLPDIDYVKVSNAYSLKFNISQDNPIIDSVYAIASYKFVRFINKKKETDNLDAQLLTGEITINF